MHRRDDRQPWKGRKPRPQGAVGEPRRTRRTTVLACVALAVILLALDTSQLVHQYAYIGMGNPAPSAVRIAATVLVAALVGAMLPGPERLPGALPVWTLAIMLVIPAVAVTPRGIPAYWLVVTVPLVGFVVLALASRVRVNLRIPHGLSRDTFLLVLASVAALCAAVVAGSYGLHPTLAGLSEMYAVRSEFETRSAAAGPLPAYASGWLVNVLAPSLIGLGVLWRRTIYVWIGVSTMVLHYLAVPSKLIVLLPVVVSLLAFFLRGKRRRLPSATSVAVAVVALVAAVWAFFPTPGNNVFAILVFRTLYIPDYVASLWIPYFSAHSKGNFADAIPLLGNDYDVALPKVMARLYQQGVGSANANLWTDGYANLGYTGTVLVSVVIGAVLATATTIARNRDIRACTVIFVGPGISLLNNAAFTNLLTGGLLLAVAMIAMLDESEAGKEADVSGS